MGRGTHKTRALNKLKELGYQCDDVEVHERWGPRTRDLFNILDLLGVCGTITVGLQVTSVGNVSARVKKILISGNAQACLKAGWLIEVWGVYDTPPRDGRFALCRKFRLVDGHLSVEKGSDILPTAIVPEAMSTRIKDYEEVIDD